jgi:hypothetical protein
MYNNKKIPTGGLLAAGLAAFAYYKYSKMSAEEKTKLTSNIKDQAQKLYDDYMPQQFKDMLQQNKKPSTPQNATSKFGEGGGYSN